MNKRALLLPLLMSGLSLGTVHAKELAGAYTPASEICPTPEEARAKMTVPEGYEVRCFAHEPMVQNPVAMTWDHQGRLWVVEAYEYPNGSEHPAPFGGAAADDQYHPMPKPVGDIPRDRVIILEDTDNDGVADKRTVFVEGLNLASAILCGDDGVYIGQQPHLLHFRDADGDDKPDAWRVCLTGFGREDTHELVNSFTWGPDGWLYMTHGVFTNSKVRRPGQLATDGAKFDAGIGRARPIRKLKAPGGEDGQAGVPASPPSWEFEVFADGTSNPWGCDYDAAGNFFVSACVIDHFFHMAPGGIYVRQGGAPENPYSYELLPSIVKHKHFRAAYAGVQIYQGGVYPKDVWGHAFIGNIHDNAIHEEVISPVGAGFKCEPRRDFLRANDGWFRPVSTQTGPDGFLWVMDWCDKYPCYQNAKANPEGVDRDRGRIWRVQYVGTPDESGKSDAAATLIEDILKAPPPAPPLAPPGTLTTSRVYQPVFGGQLPGSRDSKELDLKKLSTAELVKTLEHPNNWMRRTARRMLVEQSDITAEEMGGLSKLAFDRGHVEAFWTLINLEQYPDLDRALGVSDTAFKIWFARTIGSDPFHEASAKLSALAKDADPQVRNAVAVAARQAAGVMLTHPRPASHREQLSFSAEVVGQLIQSSADADPRLAFHIWMALEPLIVQRPAFLTQQFALLAPAAQPLSSVLSQKAMRRLCDGKKAENLDLAVEFCDKLAEHNALLANALEGLVKGQEGGIIKPVGDVSKSLAAWRNHKDENVRNQARQLAVLWGDPAAIGQVVETLLDKKQPLEARLAALQSLRQVKTDAAKAGYAKFLKNGAGKGMVIEAMRAAVDLGDDSFAAVALGLWKDLNPQQRIAAAESLASRSAWSLALLDAIASGGIARGDLPMTVARSLTNHPDAKIKDRAAEVIGVWKESSDDIKALITAKKKACLTGTPDLANGKLMFQATCMVCHEFHGGGQKVGPDLIGSGRSNLDAILANVIDPNQIIGNGYENIIVATKDGRTLAGRLVEDTPGHVKLLGAGGAAQTVARDQVATLTNTHQSLMPMGFGGLPDAAFRDLIWYILAPPEEGPLTKDKKDLLTKGLEAAAPVAAKPKTNWRAIDWESVSLWNPDWKVTAPDYERTPVKLADYYGRSNVLMLHPFEDKKKQAAFEQTFKVQAGKTKLRFAVAADDRGDWLMKVMVNGQAVQELSVDHTKPRWKEVAVDLGKYSGQEITVRLETHATGWYFEYAYWHGISVGQ